MNLYQYIPVRQSELIAAGLKILKAYHCAGRPDQGLEPYGSFNEWSGWVRSALVRLDCADPCLTRTRLEVSDPETAKLAALLRAWHGILGSQSYTVREAVEFSLKQGNEELKAAFLEVAAVKGKPHEVDTVRLGNWIRHCQERIVKGYRFERTGKTSDRVQWIVTQV